MNRKERRPRPPEGRDPRRRQRERAAAPLGGEGLPRWVSEELTRVTPRGRTSEALAALERAATAFSGAKFGRALQAAEEAKGLSPRDATVREVLGLAAYRLGRWEQALRELRTYRRFTGDTTHLPVEIDVLRALERPEDVEDAWSLLRRLGGSSETMDEGKVVYASFLLDSGRAQEAWRVAEPGRLEPEAAESRLRVWYVAARAAARLGDGATARRLYEAIGRREPGFPGLDALEAAIGEVDGGAAGERGRGR
jgi:tetratricopeptide (TPR) repeat protein